MDTFIGWFVVAFGLLVAELLTGTFYLLVISMALAVAGLAALAGAPFALQLVVAAAIGIGGSIWLRATRFGKRLHERGDDRIQNMDIGQSLRVDNWTPARTARANYRGAVWDVELAPGEQPASGEFVIREIHANRLIVAPKPR
ncbi:MAG: NfeD-like family protein 1 [Burkholderiaceae bacterium]|jgi:membrane protein implicated in regulation of membrane protease activity|nr:NfeD-like family protein 1 [Burkholderiaceae bacterium]